MVLVVFLLYFTMQKLQSVKRLTSGDLPRNAAAGKKEQKGRQSSEQRLETQHTSHAGREMQWSGVKKTLLLSIALGTVANGPLLNAL